MRENSSWIEVAATLLQGFEFDQRLFRLERVIGYHRPMSDSASRRDFLSRSAALGATAMPIITAPPEIAAQQRLVLNDASRLSATPVFSHWVVKSDPQDQLIARIRNELKAATGLRRAVVVGAARHSMGGQSLPRNGAAMTFDLDRCQPNRAAKTYRVFAGTRWHQVISHLDKIGFSPAVMQSNSDFGVASTLSVNAHGWPAPYGPFGSTVRSFRIMLSSGDILTCSRSENAELFGLVMGGYGLFGIVLDLEVDMVENALMNPRFELMPAKEFASRFVKAIKTDRDVKMIYGRLNVGREDFFTEALLVTMRPLPDPAGGLPPTDRGGGTMSGLSRRVYRAQIGSETGKKARWMAETVAAPKTGGPATRNTLMNEPVLNLENRDKFRTDILHEYFVAPERFNDFVKVCRDLIPKARTEFLNVTLRYVAKDETSVMSFATTDRIAAVMSFSQEMNGDGEADMLRLTEALIDAVGAIGGSYYLPYRLHARQDQFERVYANSVRFAERKKHYDPGLLFRNALWDSYLAG